MANHNRFLTEEQIYQFAPNAKAAQSGLALVKESAFLRPRCSPDRTWLSARCQGSWREPYLVRIDLASATGPQCECDCSSFQRPCKHALGLMFLVLRQPELFEEHPAAKWPRRETATTDLPQGEPLDSPDPSNQKTSIPVTTSQALFQLICNDPDDPCHRLIYADWLDEHGDAAGRARAQFIRLQCRLAEQRETTPDDPLLAEEKRLWEKHRKTWLADVPRHLRTKDLVFHRGFLEEVHLTVQAFLKYAGPLFDTHPLYRLKIQPPVRAEHATQFAKSPLMSRLRVLDGSGAALKSPKALRLLLNTPFACHLTKLDLSRSDMTHAGLRVLLEIDFLTDLRDLVLAQNALGDAAAEAISQSPRLASLRSLDLRGNPLGNKGAQALAASPHLEHLSSLDLRDSGIGPSGVKALKERFGERVRV